jgi:hypothetical protein
MTADKCVNYLPVPNGFLHPVIQFTGDSIRGYEGGGLDHME